MKAMPENLNKKPLSVSLLERYDLTERGAVEALNVLAALKASQSEYRRCILLAHQDVFKRQDDVHRCGQWIFFKHYFKAGTRSFAGGYTCKQHWHCLPCAFRRAYVTSAHVFCEAKALMAKHGYVPALVSFGVAPGPGLAERFKLLKAGHRKTVMRRPACFPFIKGSFGCYDFCFQEGRWFLRVDELILIDQESRPAPAPRAITDKDLFLSIFDFALNSVLLLPPEQQWEAAELLCCTYPFLFTGCLAGLKGKIGNDSSDPSDPSFAHEPFQGEEYVWNREQLCYELRAVNSGEESFFPFAEACCPSTMSRRRSKSRRSPVDYRPWTALKAYKKTLRGRLKSVVFGF